jgi:glycosyltransferase involved in cell wall biosynthesis
MNNRQPDEPVNNLTKGRATICIVNYKTIDLTRLCLRSIRKFTHYPYDVIVVDNDSKDESLQYLKSLDWVQLIERHPEADKPIGGYAHGAALDLGLSNCTTEFFISLHSDTVVIRDGWLGELMNYFDNDQAIACVGTGKIELAAQWRIILKNVTDLRTFKRKLLREPDPLGKYRYYNRTICCIYRTEVLKREKLSFLMDIDKGLTSGKKLYFELVDRGYETVELPAASMKPYVLHLAHATQAVNPQEFTLRQRTLKKYNRLSAEIMSSRMVNDIMTDNSLDK